MSAVVGQGKHVYSVEEGWGRLPEGVSFGYTHGVVTDAQDRVYIFNTSKDAVIVFTPEGDYIESWGERFANGAHGMLLHEENGTEYLYLVDTSTAAVVKTTLKGETVLELTPPDRPDLYDAERKYVPTDVAVAPNGDIYVADGYGQSWIHRYDKEGNYRETWGGPGPAEEPGKLKGPHGISVVIRDGNPLIYIADRSNQRIQVFTLEGRHVKFVYDEMNFPCSFFQKGDELFLPDLRSRVTILDKDDKLAAHLGAANHYQREGWPNLPLESIPQDEFSSPHGICVDSKGNIYVAEWISVGRVTKLVPQR